MTLIYSNTNDNDHHEPYENSESSAEYSTGGYPDRDR